MLKGLTKCILTIFWNTISNQRVWLFLGKGYLQDWEKPAQKVKLEYASFTVKRTQVEISENFAKYFLKQCNFAQLLK